MKMMVGSYGPKKDLNCYTTSLEDVPSGMLARGTYTIKSQFTDDDKNNYLEWQFGMEIKKDWENWAINEAAVYEMYSFIFFKPCYIF